jgi:TatD DNase family protein
MSQMAYALMVIDSHCHLADSTFSQDLLEVIRRAKDAGVDRMIAIADSLPEAERCIVLADTHPELWCTVGVHPHCAKDWKPGDGDRLKELAARSKRVRAIGEIGLDYHYNFSDPDIQRQAFADQLTIASDLELPVVVHCREAVEDVWAIVREMQLPGLVIHCCTEKWEDVQRFVDNGFSLSFTGIATYKNGEVIRECIRRCPIERLMIETDAPYLAPVPHRGKRNEPAFVVKVAELVAELKGLPLAEVDAITTRNTVQFFGLPS